MLESKLKDVGSKLKDWGKKIVVYESGVGLVKRIKSNLTSKEINFKEKFALPMTDIVNLIFRYGITAEELYLVLPYAIQGRYKEAIFGLAMMEALKLGYHGICSAARYGVDRLVKCDNRNYKIENTTPTN